MLLRALAERISQVTYDSLPAAAVAMAKQGILDTTGVTLAGANDDTTATVARALRMSTAPGPALIFGGSDRIDVLNAALINGTASHALDFDDCSNTLGGHPSAPILPALWAIAPGAGGQAFITAYAAGFECETRLARAVHFHHYDKGWHPTATLGTFGSAAACGHLLQLTVDQLATALALAASMACGIKANFGTMTKPFHVGQTARNGLLAALLAREGMTANAGALEHPQGFFAVYNGAGTFNPDRIFEHWGDPYDLADPGIAFKRHPCCGSTHPAVDAMLHLRQTHGLSAERVAKVESWTHPRRLAHTNRPDPKSGLAGKFSIQYVLARALMHGIVSMEHFSDEAVREPSARAMTARVHSVGDPAAKSDTNDHFYCRLKITTANGEVFEHFQDRPVGRDIDHPLPAGALEAKFRDCARLVLDAQAVETVVRLIGALETLPDVAEVVEAIATGVKAVKLPRAAPMDDVTDLAREQPDVLVVGAGNAALCTAISASEHGARVLMLEAAPFEERGGNSHFTGGAFRFAYRGVEDLLKVLPAMANEDLSNIDFGSYTEEHYFDDMFELTQYRTDQDLCEILVRNSLETAAWVHRQGVKLQPGLGRQAYQVDGKFKFWGGLALHIWGGGPEMLNALYATAERYRVRIVYETPAVALIRERGRVTGVVAEHKGERVEIRAGAVVLACGSYESNPAMRAQYLGPGWELAKIRGTRFNMGAGLNMALAIGARPYGNFSGCHSVAWDINAPPYGDLTVGDQFQKHNYPFGLLINARGERYVDEALNFHSHTYAKYGGEIMRQPGMFAWQVFDAKASPLLRGEYRIRRVTKAEANTLEELAPKLDGVDPEAFLRTVREYNAACTSDVPFNPNILDGRATRGLAIEKTNWAVALDTPPFHAYHVTTGVTFTFGGVKISKQGEVEDLYGRTIPGLYAAGEMVGGLFFHNYASGTGLMSGATFGRLAGRNAAQFAGAKAPQAAVAAAAK